MEAKHDGEGAGGQQLLVVVVVVTVVIQAVSRCQGKSVSNALCVKPLRNREIKNLPKFIFRPMLTHGLLRFYVMRTLELTLLTAGVAVCW